MNAIYKDLIYLLSCAVNGITPDTARVQQMNMEQLYMLAKYHSVRAAVCISLKRAGFEDKQFDQAYKKAVRKNIYLDIERNAILSDFEEQGIWYMPLKGAVLKELYPENGMREMADNDVLFDLDKREQSKEIMLAHAYTAENYGKSNHDVYQKPPVLNFELHTALFDTGCAESIYKYYADTKRLLLEDEDNCFGYHFSDEDFYVYMTVHEWKHYNSSGTGIRSLLDCYVFCKEKCDTLDWEYITEQCRQLEIDAFEQKRRALAFKVLSSETLSELTESQEEMLLSYLTEGAYGTFENSVKLKMKNQSRTRYMLHYMFPSLTEMKTSVKFVNRFPVLYPVGIVWRYIRVLTCRRGNVTQTIKAVRKHGKKEQSN